MDSQAVLDKTIEVQAWLDRAASGSCMLLSTDADANSLSLRALATHVLTQKLNLAQELSSMILRGKAPSGKSISLSCAHANKHERGWIVVADLHEKILAALNSGSTPDYIICLDPWAASLKVNLTQLAPKASWIFVSDSESARVESEQE